MLTLDNLSLQLEGRRILSNISFTLCPQQITALVGRNGSGKSSLLACINRQYPYTGSILLQGNALEAFSPRQRARQIAYLPQQLPAPHITVRELAELGRNPYLDLTGRFSEQDRQAVEKALGDADAADLALRYVDTLSGGERQRAALAMILAQNTPLVLLDEPTSHMDLQYEAAFLDTLTTLKHKQRKTFLIVLHDLATAVEYADNLLVLDSGNLVFAGTREDCLRQQVLENTFCLQRFTVNSSTKEQIFFSAKPCSG